MRLKEGIDVDKFKIIDPTLPSNWIFDVSPDAKYLNLAPARWLDDSLWQYSFWESYWDGDAEEQAKARKVFKEEYDKMLAECGQGLL